MKTNISLNDSIHFWDQTAHKIKDDIVKKLMKVMKCENELQVMVYHSVTWYACLHFIKRKLKTGWHTKALCNMSKNQHHRTLFKP